MSVNPYQSPVIPERQKSRKEIERNGHYCEYCWLEDHWWLFLPLIVPAVLLALVLAPIVFPINYAANAIMQRTWLPKL